MPQLVGRTSRTSTVASIVSLVGPTTIDSLTQRASALSNEVDDTVRRSTIDVLWRNLLTPEFETKFQTSSSAHT